MQQQVTLRMWSHRPVVASPRNLLQVQILGLDPRPTGHGLHVNNIPSLSACAFQLEKHWDSLPITVRFPNQVTGMSTLDWNQIPHMLCARHQLGAGRTKPLMALPVCPLGYGPFWQCSFIPQSYPNSSLKGKPSLKQLWNSQRTFHRTEVLKLIIEWMEEGSKKKKAAPPC